MPELPTLWHVEVRLTPDLEAKLNQLSAQTGRAKEDLVQDAITGYLTELSRVGSKLDGRYDDNKRGRTQPIDGEEAFTRCGKRRAPVAVPKAFSSENVDRRGVEQAL